MEFDGIERSMRALGAGDADIARVRAQWDERQRVLQLHDERIEVYPENVPYFRALLLLQDQWEYPDGFGGGRLAIGLAEREVAMRVCGIAITSDNHARMAAMLGAARKALRAQIDRAARQRRR